MFKELEFNPESENIKPTRLFLEIGASGTQNVPMVGELQFGPQHLYLGIDHDSAEIQKAIDLNENRYASFEEGDGHALPLPDNSFDEVMLGNVLGSKVGNLNNNGDKLKIIQERILLIREAARVLEIGGQLVIKETLTPLPPEVLEEIFEGVSELKLTKAVVPNDEEWASEIKTYDNQAPLFGHQGLVFVIFEKLAKDKISYKD